MLRLFSKNMSSSKASKKDFLEEKTRAEDIILGSLGFGEEAKIISIKKDKSGFSGVGKFFDGEEFNFSSEDSLDEIEEWALAVLLKSYLTSNKLS